MQNRSADPYEQEEYERNRVIDNAIIAMSLQVTRLMMKRFKAPKAIRMHVLMRMDQLIEFYRSNPTD